ncbi:MAG: hypothetical protein U0269_37945 [Polyangiales bacterium]
MESVPSPLDVLDDALDRAVSGRMLARALAHVARNAAVGAVERDGVVLRRALAPALISVAREPRDELRSELAKSLDAVREVVERSSRRTNGEAALAAAKCALRAVEITQNVALGVSGNERLAVELLAHAEAAIDRQYTWPRTPADQVACAFAAFLPSQIPGWPDYDEVARSLMRPAQKGLDAVIAALEGVSEGDEAWEVLAARALIPVDWAGDDTRSFRGGVRDRWGKLRRATVAFPPDVQSAITLAVDPDGVLAAERLAREFASSLRAWDQREPSHFEWAVLDRRGMLDVYRGPWPSQLERALRNIRLSTAERAWAEGRASMASNVEWSGTYVPAGLRETLSLAEFWRVMVEIDATFPQSDPVPEAWQGEKVANVRCAFAALLSLWGLGYALVSFDGERAHLAAPMATVGT